MRIDNHRMGSVSILSPCGAIAQDEVESFSNEVEECRKKTNGRMVLEFSQVSYLDSNGVEALWDLANRQRQAGQTTKLASVPELCREIFALTGIAEHLDMFDSPESAVKSFL